MAFATLGLLTSCEKEVVAQSFSLKDAFNGMKIARENGNEAFSLIGIVLTRNFQNLEHLEIILGRDDELVRGTLKEVVEARFHAMSITIDPSNYTPEQMNVWNQAQGNFTQALGRLMMALENYSELRDLKVFQDVRDELAGAINRLAEARRKYNEQAKVYNIKVQTFPNNFLAGMFGFQPMFYYEAPAGTEENATD